MKVVWDQTGKRLYEAGVRNAVLYPIQDDGLYTNGVAWNGVRSIAENPSGAEATPLWADDIKYLSLTSAEEFGATVNAYTYPDEFAECDGSVEIAPGVFAGQQNRKMFGLCYRTILGNDVNESEHGYKLHLIYGAKAAPSEKEYSTLDNDPDAIEFSWELTTTPVEIPTLVKGRKLKPTSCLTFDSTKTDPAKMAALEEILYGKDESSEGAGDGADPRLPLPEEVITLMMTTEP